jgi:hypothetical protein
MAAIFTFPKSQPLRFVRHDAGILDQWGAVGGYLSDFQTIDNRLIPDEKWAPDDEIKTYHTKFTPKDPILIQFTTNWNPSNITAKLYTNLNAQVGSNLTITNIYPYTDGSGLNTFKILIDTTGLALGVYYIIVAGTNPVIELVSDTFEIGLFELYPYISWTESETDGIFYELDGTTVFGMRVEERSKDGSSSEDSIYNGFDFQPELENAVEKGGEVWTFDPIARPITEKLRLASGHVIFKKNGVQYQRLSAPSIENIEGSNMYTCEIEVQEKMYEDYSFLAPLSGLVLNPQALTDFEDVPFIDYNDEQLLGYL